MNKPTKKIIASMLRERTGVAMCDSGGTPHYDENGKYTHSTNGYGRAYERNQGRDFDNEPKVALRFHKWVCRDGSEHQEIESSINVYHYLVDRLNYECEMDKLYECFIEMYNELTDDRWNEYQYQHEFIRFLNLKPITDKTKIEDRSTPIDWNAQKDDILKMVMEHKLDSFYQDSDDTPELLLGQSVYIAKFDNDCCFYGYTYNHENALSQNIVVTPFTWFDTQYVWLSIHNGCDARGGFTDARIFTVDDSGLSDFSELSIGCDNGHVWDSENGGYSFRKADTSKMEDVDDTELQDYPMLDDEEWQAKHEAWLTEHKEQIEAVAARKAGQALMPGADEPTIDDEPIYGIRITEDGKGYCPICGDLLTGFQLH